MKFSIVIPAYNEEKAVQDILRRSLRAAENIKNAGLGIDQVEVILVNDGSSDRTEELAKTVAGARVIGYSANRGYGAAIKTGFEQAGGDFVSFLDADGTCDPEFFIPLLRLLKEKNLDVVSGSRMHSGSKMPWVRQVGNWVFRSMVNFIGASSVDDVASGMRVLRRSALDRLYPLPDGLNFTPAMSVRAVLDARVRMGELPMPYEERVGRSKLNVVKDGFRFLGIILDTAITFRPLLFFGLLAQFLAVLAVLALGFAWGGPSAPLSFYFQNHRVEDWMIFRMIFITWLLATAAFLAGLGVVAQSLVAIVNEERNPRPWDAWLEEVFNRFFFAWGGASLAFAVILNRRPLISYWRTGHIPNELWVIPLVGSAFALIGAEFIAFGWVGRIARLLRERERFRRGRMGAD